MSSSSMKHLDLSIRMRCARVTIVSGPKPYNDPVLSYLTITFHHPTNHTPNEAEDERPNHFGLSFRQPCDWRLIKNGVRRTFSGAGARLTKIICTSSKEIGCSESAGGFSPLYSCHRLPLRVRHPRPGAELPWASGQLLVAPESQLVLWVFLFNVENCSGAARIHVFSGSIPARKRGLVASC